MSNNSLVIGLDAASWDVIEDLLEKGQLKYISEVLEGGACGKLESTIPPMTPLAWTSISTGTNPGKHGIYDFTSLDTSNYQIHPTEYSEMTRPTVWDTLNFDAQKTGVINYPMVNPPDKVDGFFVSGFPTPDEGRIAYPKEVEEYISQTDFRIHPNISKKKPEPYLQELIDLTKSQCELTILLEEEYDVDMLCTVFMALDWGQHYLWDKQVNGERAIYSLYKTIDDVIGKLLEELDDREVLIISDHGAGPIKSEIHMNSLLEKLGYLKQSTGISASLSKLREKLWETIWKTGVNSPDFLQRIAKSYLSPDTIDETQRKAGVGQYDMHKQIDWQRTTAFSFGAMGKVFINSVERFEHGTVSELDIQRVRGDILQELEELKHPETGEPIVDIAAPASEVYHGQMLTDAPDIVFSTTEDRHMIYGDFAEDWIHTPQRRQADHRRIGIFIASGESIMKANGIEASVEDIAPTLLHLHDSPIVEDMDGGVLTEIFQDNRAIDTVSKEEIPADMKNDGSKQNITDRLEDLGYL